VLQGRALAPRIGQDEPEHGIEDFEEPLDRETHGESRRQGNKQLIHGLLRFMSAG
jgi:hypothetical protein